MLQDPATKDFSVPSPEECQDLFTNAPIGVFTVTQEGRLLSANLYLAQLHGYDTPGEMIGSIIDMAGQLYADPKERERLLHQLEVHGQVQNFECRLLRRDRSVFWASINIRAVRDKTGGLTRYQGFVSDISARKQAEETLRESEQRFQKMLSLIPDMVSMHDPDMKIIYSNWNGFASVPEEKRVLNSKCYKTYRGYDQICPDCKAVKVLESRKAVEEETMLPDGTWVDLRVIPVLDQDGNVEFFVEWVRDITSIKQWEEELSAGKRLLEGIIDGVQDVLSIQYPDHSIERYNKAGYDLLGMNREQVKGRKCFELIGRNRQCEECATQKALQTGKLEQVERYVPELDMYLDCRSNPVLDDNGNVIQIVAQLRDITQQKQTENALLESEQKYRQLFEFSPISLWEQDFSGVKERLEALKARGVQDLRAYFSEHPREVQELAELVKVLNFNQATLKLYRAASKEELFAGITTIFAEESFEDFLYALLMIDQGEKEFFLERKHVTLDGEPLNVNLYWSVAPGHEESYSCVLVSIVDITERKRNEERLKYLSLHDQLTGLYNRAYLENELKRLSRSREHPVTIMSIDVDGLKAVNDMFGHVQGDRILKLTADILQETFRASDILGRAGGDEFTALLPGTDAQAGRKIVQRIRSRVEKYNREKQDTQLPLSLSMGMAVAGDGARDLFAVFKEADDLMYRDKLNKDVTVRSRIMRTIMAAMEERDFITHGHARRLEDLSKKLGERAGLSEKQLSDLALLAQVHDMGKVGIPDHVLFKEAPLTDEEWEIMYQHPEKGYRIARASTDLSEIADLILKHHERWDGEGYPLGLEGEEIPVECRILAIADAYDAMTSDRPYRRALARKDAIAELKRCSGTRFDPDLVDKSIEIIQQFN